MSRMCIKHFKQRIIKYENYDDVYHLNFKVKDQQVTINILMTCQLKTYKQSIRPCNDLSE